MFFHTNGQDRVRSEHPATELTTNAASRMELPLGHRFEHILRLEVRSKLDGDGGMVLTGLGPALPLHRLQRRASIRREPEFCKGERGWAFSM
jgi:hypothetical protein